MQKATCTCSMHGRAQGNPATYLPGFRPWLLIGVNLQSVVSQFGLFSSQPLESQGHSLLRHTRWLFLVPGMETISLPIPVTECLQVI